MAGSSCGWMRWKPSLRARAWRHSPRPPLAVPGLPIGAPAPNFRLAGLYGETLTLDALRAPGKPVMLIFTDPNCGPCQALLPDLAGWQREHAAELTLALISRGTPEANRAKLGTPGVSHVLLQEDQEVASAYQAAGTPTAVLVRPDGTIGSALAARGRGDRGPRGADGGPAPSAPGRTRGREWPVPPLRSTPRPRTER